MGVGGSVAAFAGRFPSSAPPFIDDGFGHPSRDEADRHALVRAQKERFFQERTRLARQDSR